jgi:hypothetical protein
VKSIIEEKATLHLFTKKDDAEGSDFYYLGSALPSDPKQTTMPGSDGKALDVVTMTLSLDSAIESALYDYLVSAGES